MRTRADRLSLLSEARLYCCTDARGDLTSFTAFVDDLFTSGVDIVQFRDKLMEPRQAMPYIAAMRESALRHNKLSCVNDRADLAAIAGVDIVHVGQDDLTPTQAREIVGSRVLIGRSTHAIEESLEADADPEVDYFAVGPVWPTPTKPGRPAPGLQLVRAVASQERAKPWFAIGGVDLERMPEVVAAGAKRVVVVRALTAAADPGTAAIQLRRQLQD